MAPLVFGDERSIKYRDLYETGGVVEFMQFERGVGPIDKACSDCAHFVRLSDARSLFFCSLHMAATGRNVKLNASSATCGVFTALPESKVPPSTNHVQEDEHERTSR